jgi:hypothetical protein
VPRSLLRPCPTRTSGFSAKSVNPVKIHALVSAWSAIRLAGPRYRLARLGRTPTRRQCMLGQVHPCTTRHSVTSLEVMQAPPPLTVVATSSGGTIRLEAARTVLAGTSIGVRSAHASFPGHRPRPRRRPRQRHCRCHLASGCSAVLVQLATVRVLVLACSVIRWLGPP